MKGAIRNRAPYPGRRLRILSLVLTVLFCLWPLLVWVWSVFFGGIGIGDLRDAFGLLFVLVPMLGVLSFLVAALNFAIFGLKRWTETSIAVAVLTGCLISYLFLYVFDRKVNWQESHVSISSEPVFGVFK